MLLDKRENSTFSRQVIARFDLSFVFENISTFELKVIYFLSQRLYFIECFISLPHRVIHLVLKPVWSTCAQAEGNYTLLDHCRFYMILKLPLKVEDKIQNTRIRAIFLKNFLL